MSDDDPPQNPNYPYHAVHLTPEELAHLPPEELLRASLEFRSLLQTIMGVLSTPEVALTVRVVAMDLLYSQAQRISKGQMPDEASPVVSDIKQVSQRLGLRPQEVRKAYETLEELGGIEILEKRFPSKRQTQLPLPLEKGTTDKA